MRSAAARTNPHRSAPGPKGLAACVGLALLLHGALFASIWTGNGSIGGRPAAPAAPRIAAMELRQIQPTPWPVPATDAVPPASPEAAPAVPAEMAEAAREAESRADATLRQEPGMPEGELSIAYPDAPLPEGRMALRVRVRLDAAGRFSAFETDRPMPEAFASAVERGLAAAAFTPGLGAHGAVDAALCLSIVFDEQHPEVEVRRVDAASNAARCLKPRA